MNCRAGAVVVVLSVGLFHCTATAQVVIQPTSNPTVTAENEPWYLNGEPVTHAGSLYYPAGPRVYFNGNEMVRSGFYMGIPLYTRTTIEPYSVVYLPVGPGVMQPYERPRIGALAETSGSIASALRPMQESTVTGTSGSPMLQAAGPASQTTTTIPVYIPPPGPVGTTGSASSPEADPVERTAASGNLPAPVRRARIGGVPQGSNSIFIEFQGVRYYKAGAAETIDTSRMSRAGTYAGVPVWTAPGSGEGVIYVPVTQQGGPLAVPYSRKRP
jgi:hypothetical protein